MVSKEKFIKFVHISLKTVLSSDDITISNDETFEDYGVDSLDRMSLLLELEAHLEKDLQELELVEINTINLLYEYLYKNE